MAEQVKKLIIDSIEFGKIQSRKLLILPSKRLRITQLLKLFQGLRIRFIPITSRELDIALTLFCIPSITEQTIF